MTELIVVVVAIVFAILLAGTVFGVALAMRGRKQAAASGGALSHTPEDKLHRRLVAAARKLLEQPLGGPASIEKRADIDYRMREIQRRLAGGEHVAVLEPEVRAIEAEVVTLGRQAADEL